jgi:hypothetical protein
MKPPREMTRITKTRKPKHQFYQPGFNIHNGCWLWGDWVDVTQAEYEALSQKHQADYGSVYQTSQHHQNPGIALENLTPAQHQAWQFFSGSEIVSVFSSDGECLSVDLETAGANVRAVSVHWLRVNECKVLPRVRNGYTGEITRQLEGVSLPEDLWAPDTEPVPDPVAFTVKQNKEDLRLFQAGMVEESSDEPSDFYASMAIRGLLRLEEEIIRTEWVASCGEFDPYADLEGDLKVYAEERYATQVKLGENFSALYERSRASHNECARHNRDSGLFAFVLPVFHADGTHEPWGAENVPLPRV